MKRIAIAIILAGSALAQDRDFLTADEVDQVRLAQEPNDRLKLYIEFAKLRVSLIEQLISKEKPGRSALIHDTLEDYQNIIEAIDTVTDDALKRKAAVDEGVKAVAAAEAHMLASLKKIQDAAPSDLSRYRFVLDQAVATTQDSIDLSSEDLGKRAAGVEAKDAQEKKEREAAMSEGERSEKQQAAKKEAGKKSKAPTPVRPGEKKPDQK